MSHITLPTGTIAERADPPQPTDTGAGLVLAPDIGGLRPLFDEMCARLATELARVVVAPEPFPGRESMTTEERLAAMAEVDDTRQLEDIFAAAEATGCARVAVLGFCMGGMYALHAAASERFERSVSFYGMIRIPAQWRGPGHSDPVDALAPEAPCPVLAIIGGRDIWTPPGDVENLKKVGNVEVVVYPEAEHAFVHDPARPSHRAEDAADAWRRVREFLVARQ